MVSKNSEFEQIALDYELKSVISDKKPSVTGTITSRLFNLTTDPLDEYEIYGGIEIEFPVFDGGARDARIEGLNVQKIVARSQLREELDRIDEEWFELSAEQDDKETLIGQEEQRLNTLRDRIESLKKRLEAVQVTIVDLTDVELSRTQSIRSLKAMEWDLVRIAVQKADSADKLLAQFNTEIPF
jgi:outer membrane protein TolC